MSSNGFRCDGGSNKSPHSLGLIVDMVRLSFIRLDMSHIDRLRKSYGNFGPQF